LVVLVYIWGKNNSDNLELPVLLETMQQFQIDNPDNHTEAIKNVPTNFVTW
jgi:hypothetical protein